MIVVGLTIIAVAIAWAAWQIADGRAEQARWERTGSRCYRCDHRAALYLIGLDGVTPVCLEHGLRDVRHGGTLTTDLGVIDRREVGA